MTERREGGRKGGKHNDKGGGEAWQRLKRGDEMNEREYKGERGKVCGEGGEIKWTRQNKGDGVERERRGEREEKEHRRKVNIVRFRKRKGDIRKCTP